MKEKTFRISTSWSVGKDVDIKAETLEQARAKAYKLSAQGGEYIEDSFVIDSIEEVHSEE